MGSRPDAVPVDENQILVGVDIMTMNERERITANTVIYYN
jgi:hypothetical protein